MRILGIIPSRYASTRFPGKPLAIIDGKTMIQRVYEQAGECESITRLMVATDHEAIYNHVKDFGGEAVMTSQNTGSGTERCYEALTQIEKQDPDYDVVINIQGDEPFINPEQIEKVAALFTNKKVEIGTLIKKTSRQTELNDPNVVKVIKNVSDEAIYFSRSAIPFIRDKEINDYDSLVFYKHIGLYGYRTEVLKKLVALPPANLEKAESLEQLRWIENGFKIHTAETDRDIIGIDTYDDLIKVTKT